MRALARTLLAASILVALVLVGYWRLRVDERDAALEELRVLQAEMEEQLAARQDMIDRLSRTRRVAHLEILDQRRDTRGGVAETDLRFIELDEQGSEIARQDFTIPGDVLFVDAWTVKFAHDAVAAGHPLYGRSLVLLRRLYSDRMAPRDGFPIDTPGAIPPGYAGTDIGRFEQHVWAHFWDIAADPALAAAMGVRVAQGEAVYKPVHPGQRFSLLADASGGMSLVPLARADDVDDADDVLTRAR
jgi:hypothetical protein